MFVESANFNFIDLFAGAGGLSEGFLNNRFNPIAHVEMDKYASETLKTRMCYYYFKKENQLETYYSYLRGEITRDQLYDSVPETVLETVINEEISDKTYKDIFNRIDEILKKDNVNTVDVVVGGPPCQAYSLAGRAADPNGMRADPRNNLYIQYARFLKKYHPRMFVFENVPGMFTAQDGQVWKKIQKRLKTVGYNIEYREVYANEFGVLQKRRRIIIVGWQKGIQLNLPQFHKFSSNALVNDLLSDLPPLEPGEMNNTYQGAINRYLTQTCIRLPEDVLTLHETRPIREIDREIYRIAINMWNNDHSRLKYTDLPVDLQLMRNNTSFLDRFKVVGGDMPYCHTMLAHIAKDGHYYIHPDIEQSRSLSVREAARIQSFPDNYYFEGPRTAKLVQIGNAVPPLMAKGIATTIKEVLIRLEGEK